MISFLEKYRISEQFGFVLENPMTKLPPEFEAWNSTASNIGQLCREGKIRQIVDQLPVYNIESLLDDHKSLRLAHLQLTTIISGGLKLEVLLTHGRILILESRPAVG